MSDLTICACGDGFTADDPGICINCMTARTSSDACTIESLRTLLAQALPYVKYIADQEIYKGSDGELVDRIEEALK